MLWWSIKYYQLQQQTSWLYLIVWDRWVCRSGSIFCLSTQTTNRDCCMTAHFMDTFPHWYQQQDILYCDFSRWPEHCGVPMLRELQTTQTLHRVPGEFNCSIARQVGANGCAQLFKQNDLVVENNDSVKSTFQCCVWYTFQILHVLFVGQEHGQNVRINIHVSDCSQRCCHMR